MATNDLIAELQKDSIKLDDDSERKVRQSQFKSVVGILLLLVCIPLCCQKLVAKEYINVTITTGSKDGFEIAGRQERRSTESCSEMVIRIRTLHLILMTIVANAMVILLWLCGVEACRVCMG